MMNKLYFPCQFELVREDGVFGECGKEGTHIYKGKVLCSECAKYIKGRGEIVFTLTEHRAQKQKKKQERAVGGQQ